MSRPPPAMLFAAGRGTRMAPLTDSLPKPLIRVAGRPLLDHALDLLRDAGLTRIVANTHYLAERIQPDLKARGVAWSHEPDLLETGGGMRKAVPLLGPGPVVTLNTDCVWNGPNPVTQLLAAWRPATMDALLILVPPHHALGHTGAGDFTRDGDGRLTRAPGLVYAGVQMIKTDRLYEIADAAFSLNRLWDMMAADGRLFGVPYTGRWCDVGRPESIALAEAMLGWNSNV